MSMSSQMVTCTHNGQDYSDATVVDYSTTRLADIGNVACDFSVVLDGSGVNQVLKLMATGSAGSIVTTRRIKL